LVGGNRLTQVIDQIKVIRANELGQIVPLVMTIDNNNNHEAKYLAELLNITLSPLQDDAILRGQ